MVHFKLFLLICFTVGTTAQRKIIVLDSVSRQPVQYASIWKNDKIFTNTDSLGQFQVDNNPGNYKISAIGFEDRTIFQSEDTILLSPKSFLLNEIRIANPSFLKSIKYGQARKGLDVATGFDAKDAQLVKYIPGNQKFEATPFLKTISFYTKASSDKRKINIVFYSVGKDGNPDELINRENVICNLKKGKKLNKIELKNQKIQLPPEGIFAGIQVLLIEDNKCFAANSTKATSFFYEPFLYVDDRPETFDTWNLNDEWKKNLYFSLNLEVEISD